MDEIDQLKAEVAALRKDVKMLQQTMSNKVTGGESPTSYNPVGNRDRQTVGQLSLRGPIYYYGADSAFSATATGGAISPPAKVQGYLIFFDNQNVERKIGYYQI